MVTLRATKCWKIARNVLCVFRWRTRRSRSLRAAICVAFWVPPEFWVEYGTVADMLPKEKNTSPPSKIRKATCGENHTFEWCKTRGQHVSQQESEKRRSFAGCSLFLLSLCRRFPHHLLLPPCNVFSLLLRCYSILMWSVPAVSSSFSSVFPVGAGSLNIFLGLQWKHAKREGQKVRCAWGKNGAQRVSLFHSQNPNSHSAYFSYIPYTADCFLFYAMLRCGGTPTELNLGECFVKPDKFF